MQVQFVDESRYNPNGVVLRHIVIERCWQQKVLSAVLTFNETALLKSLLNSGDHSIFSPFYTASTQTRSFPVVRLKICDGQKPTFVDGLAGLERRVHSVNDEPHYPCICERQYAVETNFEGFVTGNL